MKKIPTTAFLVFLALLLTKNSTAYAIVPTLAIGPLAALSGLLAGLLVFVISGLVSTLGFKSLSQKMRGPKVVAWVTAILTTILLTAFGIGLYAWMGVRGLIYGAAGFIVLWAARRWGYLLRRPGAARYAIGTVAALLLVGLGTAVGYKMAQRTSAAKPDAAPASAKAVEVKDWPMFRGNRARTGNLDGVAGPKAPVGPVWAVKDPKVNIGDVSPSPAVANGRVYIAGSFASVFFRGGNVYCLDAETGKIIWRYKLSQQIFASPCVAGGRVYCGEGLHSDGNSSLYCLDATSGTLLWSFRTKSHVESSPTVEDGKVWFGAGDDGLYCLDAETGKEIWHFEGVHVDVGPAVDDERVYFGTGYTTQGMICLNRETGEKIWGVQTKFGAWGTPSVDGGALFFAIGNGNFVESAPESERFGRVICCEAATGRERWHRDVPDSVLTAIVVVGDRLYFGCRDGKVYCFDKKTGKTVWESATGGPVLSSPAVSGDMLYVGSEDGLIYAMETSTGRIAWKYDTKKVAGHATRIWSSPALAGGRLFFGTSSGYIFCLGHVEKKQPAS